MTEFGMTRGYVVMLGAAYLLVMTFAWAAPDATQFPNLAMFDRIQVAGAADVSIVQGERQSVAVPGYQAQIDVESVDGTLYIDVVESAESRPRVQITMPGIQELVVVGSADVTLTDFSGDTIVIEGENPGQGVGHIEANRIRFDHVLVTGSGHFDFDLHGRATHQDISLNGSGRYGAEGLMSQTSVVAVSGQGSVELWTEQFLDLDAADSARVTYRGEPWINRQGGAHVQARYPKEAPLLNNPPARGYTTSL